MLGLLPLAERIDQDQQKCGVHLVRRESINSIARDLELCRQTVRRHGRTEAKPSHQRSQQPMPMLGAVQQTLVPPSA